MSDIPFILTTAGAAALVNAASNGTDRVIISHCGVSPTAFTASAVTTVLTGELKRVGTLSGDVVEADTIHVVVRDESADIYSLRSLGLYTDSGVLFAVYSQPSVIMEKSGGAMLLLAIDAKFAGVNAALISFGDTNFLNPPATESRQGVIEIATQAETNAGTDDQRALTAKKARAGILGWLLAQDGAGSGLDADLLDGQQGSYYTNIPARLGYTPVQQGGGINQATTPVQIGKQSGANKVRATVGGVDFGNLLLENDLLSVLVTIDGSGSGLDADLLDGQQGSYYTNIPARLGFTPMNKGGDTMTGRLILQGLAPWLEFQESDTSKSWHWIADGGSISLREDTSSAANTRLNIAPNSAGLTLGTSLLWGTNTVWHAGNDGAGSGLDADLLDGQQGSYYRDAANLTGTISNDRLSHITGLPNGTADTSWVRLNAAGGAGEIGSSLRLYAGGGLGYTFNDVVKFRVTAEGRVDLFGQANVSGNTVWHAGNDGSGSGLDADLLDGKHASDFALLSGFESGSNANGYWRKLPDGTIEQWGTFTGAYPEGAAARTFPIPFTDLNSINVQSICLNTGASAANDMWTQAGTQSLTGFSVVFQATSSGNTAFGARWRAIGR